MEEFKEDEINKTGHENGESKTFILEKGRRALMSQQGSSPASQ
jgi:hypothetical protein